MIRLPAADDPAVSLIVLLDGAAEMAERCLQAIAATDQGVACETVVLLNDPDVELEQFVRESTSGARVILARANAGPGVGWNLGAAVARAPRLATLHEDSEPEPGWLPPLCEVMSESGAGAVGARLYNGDGSVQNCGWVLFSDASHQPLNAATAPEIVAATEPTPADMLSGAAMLVDREALRAVGGWDERFHPAVFVDIDVSTAIWNQGRPVLSVPASKVVHQSGTFDRRPGSALTGPRLRLFLLERNRRPFLAKWGLEDRATPPVDADPQNVRKAVEAALPRTHERAELVRSGEARPVGATGSAQRRFTGESDPPVERSGDGYAVAPAVEQALKLAEAELIEEYCRWLAEREAQTHGDLAHAHEALAHRQRDLDQLHEHIATLRRENAELASSLDHVLRSRTWRLRTLAARPLKRARQDSGS